MSTNFIKMIVDLYTQFTQYLEDQRIKSQSDKTAATEVTVVNKAHDDEVVHENAHLRDPDDAQVPELPK